MTIIHRCSLLVAFLVLAISASAQRATPAKELLQCKTAVAALTMPVPVMSKDSAVLAAAMRTQTVRLDSARVMARTCLARVTVSAMPDSLLNVVIDLQRQAGDTAAMLESMRRVARVGGATPAERWRAMRTYEYMIPFTRSGLVLVRDLIALADSAGDRRGQLEARRQVAILTRSIDTLAAYHAAQEVLDFLASLPPDERRTYQNDIASLAFSVTAWGTTDGNAGYASGFTARAAMLLGEAPEFQQMASLALRQIAVVGTAAPPFESAFWINTPSRPRRGNMADGKVRLVEFTSEFCVACKLSYRPIQAAYKRLSARGFEPLFCVPQEGDGEATAKKYAELFSHYDVTAPIVLEAKGRYSTYYAVSGIPHFLLIDKKGVVRDVVIGWDPESQTRIWRKVDQLLAE
jgi:hypothetical protein